MLSALRRRRGRGPAAAVRPRATTTFTAAPRAKGLASDEAKLLLGNPAPCGDPGAPLAMTRRAVQRSDAEEREQRKDQDEAYLVRVERVALGGGGGAVGHWRE